MATRTTSGTRLRRMLNDALKRAGTEVGKTLEWSEMEQTAIDRAVTTADRAEALRTRFDALATDDNPNDALLVKISSELRLCDRQVVDLVGRIEIGVGTVKSDRHVRAALARWNRSA